MLLQCEIRYISFYIISRAIIHRSLHTKEAEQKVILGDITTWVCSFIKIQSSSTFSLSLSHELKNLTSDKLYFHFSWQFPLSHHEFCVLKRNEMKMLWSIIKCIKIFKLYSLSYMLPSSDNCELWFSQKIMCCYKILFYPNNVAFGCFYKYDN